MKIYLNGNIKESRIANYILEPGLLFGWGVFETLRIYNGSPIFLKEHIQRLKEGCNKTLIKFPNTAFGKKIQILLRKNRLSHAYCRITLFKKKIGTGVLITVEPFNRYKKNDYKKGFKAIIVPSLRNSKNLLTGIKSISYLENMIARKIAIKNGKQEALFLNESGFLTEGCRSNLFFIKGKTVYTPSLECGLLDGITRQKVIKIIKKQRLNFKMGKFKIRDLLSCDE
ncbi:MAG: aminotransferase class IV, partial [Candidatus Omnitrophota bacterium]